MTSKDLEKFTGLHERGEVRFLTCFRERGSSIRLIEKKKWERIVIVT